MEAQLQARAVTYTYPGGTPAVCGVDLSLRAGEMAVLMGPNGSGKSTLLKLLGGLYSPDDGEVWLDGFDMNWVGNRVRARKIAVVPQHLPAQLDVRVDAFVGAGRYAHLGFLRSLRAHDRAAVDRALSESDVSDLGHRLVSQLSGGQRQRVLVARALAQEADLLILDEPTASLDPEHQVGVFSLLHGLVERGRAALIATHELSLVSQFAGRAILMQSGRIVAEGAPAEVLTSDVLAPVYGQDLWYGQASGGRPVVVPWRRDDDLDGKL